MSNIAKSIYDLHVLLASETQISESRLEPRNVNGVEVLERISD
jgi:hypothetical protein